MEEEFDLDPSIKVTREIRPLLDKKPSERRVIWPSNDKSEEKVVWTEKLGVLALEVTRPRSEDT